jgi:hypothetical protein
VTDTTAKNLKSEIDLKIEKARNLYDSQKTPQPLSIFSTKVFSVILSFFYLSLFDF